MKASRWEGDLRPGAIDRMEEDTSRELERKRREALVRAFECLPEKYREIFVLRDVQGLTITQTAKLVGITESTVKTRPWCKKGLLLFPVSSSGAGFQILLTTM